MLLSDIPEETFHHVQPKGLGGRIVHVESLVALEPSLRLGKFMQRIIVGNDVNLPVLGCASVNQSEERKPIFVGMAGTALAEHFTSERVQDRE